jgi:hypothetical protein
MLVHLSRAAIFNLCFLVDRFANFPGEKGIPATLQPLFFSSPICL